jgi:hypothetical protein
MHKLHHPLPLATNEREDSGDESNKISNPVHQQSAGVVRPCEGISGESMEMEPAISYLRILANTRANQRGHVDCFNPGCRIERTDG